MFDRFWHKIDEDGRLFIPSELREELGASFIVTKGMNGCLALYPEAVWKEKEAKLDALSMEEARPLRLVLFSIASRVTPKSGRVTIKDHLLKAAGIDEDREVVIVGQGRYAEIWLAKNFKEAEAGFTAELYDKMFGQLM